MLRTLTLSLLALTLFVSGCKKDAEPGIDRFLINGLHDINFNSSGSTGNSLTLEVKQMNGSQENVTLSVEDVPAGTAAVIEPSGGVPTFVATVRFTQIGPVKGGSYPIRVIGKSASSTKTYTINMIIPSSAVRIEAVDSMELPQVWGLNIAVLQPGPSAWSEQTTLSVSNLPAGLEATITNPTGKPSFTSTIRFVEKSMLQEGRYPVTLRATSASSDTTKTFTIRVGPWSGIRADGGFRRAPIAKNSSRSLAMYAFSNGSYRLMMEMTLTSGNIPEKDGTYTYTVGDYYSGGGLMAVNYYAENENDIYASDDQSTQVTVVCKAGKYSAKADNVVVKANGGLSKSISIDGREY